VFGVPLQEALRRTDAIYSQLAPYAKRRAGALSGGMKQKLALCCALVHKPELLLLDEPTTGVDAVSRQEFWDMLTKLNQEGITIVVSTPYMDEASRCTRISLVQNGSIMKSGLPTDLIASHRGKVIGVQTNQKYDTLQLLRAYPFVHYVHAFGDLIHYTDKRSNVDPGIVRTWLEQNKLNPLSVEFINPTIEDVFIQMMLEDARATDT
jgi:ABC-2 type transport system ATP-binding protein